MLIRTLTFILALALPAWGAMDFNGTTDKALSTSIDRDVTPLTMACWFRKTGTTGTEFIVGLTTNTTNNSRFALRALESPARLGAVVTGAAGSQTAETTTNFSSATWHHVTGVFTSSTSRAVYLDGGGKGTNTDSMSPNAALTHTRMAHILSAGSEILFWPGSIAECGIWNVALTDGEVATLAKGYAPPCVRRNALVAYYPMVRDATSLKDLFSATANHLTLTGGTVSDHPPIIPCK